MLALLPLHLLLLLSFATPSLAAGKITLPIEVMGETGTTNSAAFNLTDTRGIDRVYLKIHRPAYRDVSITDRGAKASYRMNEGGKWVDIDNDTAAAFPHEKEYGGIAGSYHTIRMYLPVSNLMTGNNRIFFRFNGTDGLTSGYRVLEFNLMRGNEKVLNSSAFSQDDPKRWRPFYSDRANIDQGKRLWNEAGSLAESPLSERILPVGCADCHARNGRDLKYFNYSDRSIVERSKFHGLSDTQGRQIASYIRSIDAPTPAMARPWNPPYQPGPGLDDLPVEEWAAGAGLGWVLEEPSEEAQYVLDSTSVEGLAAAIRLDGQINIRQAPIALQLPDWNAWLPHAHPGDLAPEAFYRNANFPLNTLPVNLRSYQDLYEEVEKRAARAPHVLGGRDGTRNALEQFATHAAHIHSANSYVLASAEDGEVARERKWAAMVSWAAVKQWELMHTYGLEDKATRALGENAEKRSWLSDRRNVFELAPHRSGGDRAKFSYQNLLEGKYFSTAWYQLQLILNPGNKRGHRLAPNDWNYTPNHIAGLSRAGGPRHPWRYVFAVTKMLQHYDDGRDIGNGGAGFRQIHPGRHISAVGRMFADLDPRTAAAVKGQLINATMDLIESHDVSEWPRTTSPDRRSDNELRPPSYVPKITGGDPNGIDKLLHFHYFEDAWISMIPIFQNQGVDCEILMRAVNWGEEMWPNADWNAAIDESRCSSGAHLTGTGTGLRGRYYNGVQLETFVTERTDSTINFSWGTSSPAPGVGKDLFSVEWEGYIQPRYTGRYRFETRTDDGVRLWVDRRLLINEWRFHPPTTHSGEIELVAGVKYPIRMRYLEHVAGAKATLFWSSKFQPRQVVPESQLYPPPLYH